MPHTYKIAAIRNATVLILISILVAGCENDREGADTNASTIALVLGLVIGTLVFGTLAVAGVSFGALAESQLETERARIAISEQELKELRQNLYRQHIELEKELSDARTQIAALEDAITLERAGLEVQRTEVAAEREKLEQYKKSLGIVARAVNVKKPSVPTATEWKKLSAAVQAEMFRGNGRSDDLQVNYVFDPKESGCVLFEWEILQNRPMAPTVVIYRSGKEVCRQSGEFRGRFPTRLFRRDRRYSFLFKVFDGKREYPAPLLLEVTPPPFAAWTETPKKQKTQTREQWIAENIKHLKSLRQWPHDEAQQQIILAKIEGEAAEIFTQDSD